MRCGAGIVCAADHARAHQTTSVATSTACSRPRRLVPGRTANAVAATFPDTGELIVPGGPVVEAVFPTGFAHPESPIVLVFSESISPSTVCTR